MWLRLSVRAHFHVGEPPLGVAGPAWRDALLDDRAGDELNLDGCSDCAGFGALADRDADFAVVPERERQLELRGVARFFQFETVVVADDPCCEVAACYSGSAYRDLLLGAGAPHVEDRLDASALAAAEADGAELWKLKGARRREHPGVHGGRGCRGCLCGRCDGVGGVSAGGLLLSCRGAACNKQGGQGTCAGERRNVSERSRGENVVREGAVEGTSLHPAHDSRVGHSRAPIRFAPTIRRDASQESQLVR